MNKYEQYLVKACPAQPRPDTPFSVGTRVRIRPDSQYYTDRANNPNYCSGVITIAREYGRFCFDVIWATGVANSYRLEDLERE